MTLGDYIIYRLTGIIPVMHPTNAAATGLYDLVNRRWNHDYMKALEVNKIIFPEVDEGHCVNWRRGRAEFCFREAIGDQQAALLGAGLSLNTELSINMGTGSQISILSDRLILSDRFQTRPFFENKYLLTIPHIPCGRALSVICGFLRNLYVSIMTLKR